MENFEDTGKEAGNGRGKKDMGETRRKKRRKGKSGVMSALLCLFALGALTACLVLWLQNRRLGLEAAEAAAFMETAYRQEEVEAMVEQAAEEAARQAALDKEEEILGEIRRWMEEGEGTSAMLRELYPDEIVVASEGRYHFFPITERLRHHSYVKEQFVLNEEDELEYWEAGQVVSRKGIDVSKYQGEIDWEKVAADGVEYAFIRLGIRGYGEGKLILDDAYERNAEEALDSGLDVGVYFFTQAKNREEAVEEAEFVLEHVKNYDISYPVVLDVEEVAEDSARTADMDKQAWTEVCIAFCERIKEAGYTPMIYGNLKTFFLMLDMEQLEGYEKWFAYYRTPLYFPYEFSIWQYTSTGRVDGIKGDVDLNVSMKDWG
ncbi:MAG: glycoside hydrolase family 25 protein [Lachnospiraceae bacterium]|nr:glycoside hydrolase family 25 protein [Lachnospiraceae bacterium]